MPLTPEQHQQVAEQLRKHQRSAGIKTIVLDETNDIILKLQINKDVFGSDIMSSGIYLARFLYQNQNLYNGKIVLDMGCGPGTQGIVMDLYGAQFVTFADISPKAVQNTRENTDTFKMQNIEIYESDLFAQIPKEKHYDVIVFNHPFLPATPESFVTDVNGDNMLKQSMLGGTDILKKFLKTVQDYINPQAQIVMPYFHFAGPENDPINHVESFGFKIIEKHKIISDEGLQQGDFSIYIIGKE